jgi:hypothetical protein
MRHTLIRTNQLMHARSICTISNTPHSYQSHMATKVPPGFTSYYLHVMHACPPLAHPRLRQFVLARWYSYLCEVELAASLRGPGHSQHTTPVLYGPTQTVPGWFNISRKFNPNAGDSRLGSYHARTCRSILLAPRLKARCHTTLLARCRCVLFSVCLGHTSREHLKGASRQEVHDRRSACCPNASLLIFVLPNAWPTKHLRPG